MGTVIFIAVMVALGAAALIVASWGIDWLLDHSPWSR